MHQSIMPICHPLFLTTCLYRDLSHHVCAMREHFHKKFVEKLRLNITINVTRKHFLTRAIEMTTRAFTNDDSSNYSASSMTLNSVVGGNENNDDEIAYVDQLQTSELT